jgi:hypothetical protein
MAILLRLLRLTGFFLIGWVVCYFVIMGNDFRYLFPYFFMTFTDQAGELPSFIRMSAIIFSVLLEVLISIVLYIFRKRRIKSSNTKFNK